MPITELENDSESIWVKVFANKPSHFVASWYRPPGSTNEEFKLFREQLDYIKTHHKGKKLPSAHVLGDFNFKDIDWLDRAVSRTFIESMFWFQQTRPQTTLLLLFDGYIILTL